MAGPFLSVAPRAATAAPRVRAGGWARLTSVLLWGSVILALVVAGAAAFGIRTAVVLTGSMQPALDPDDMILVRATTAGEVRPGQIVSFSAPNGSGAVITHRIESIGPAPGGDLAFVTRGDANNTSERWTIDPDGSLGRVVGVMPGVGAATTWTGDPALRFAVFGLLGALLLVLGLRWIWRRP